MLRRRAPGPGTCLAAVLALLLPFVALRPAAPDEGDEVGVGSWQLEAGFATVDLTPDRPVPLGGYEAREGKPFAGVHDPVRARAMVLRQGASPGSGALAVVSLDLIGVSARLREVLLRRLADLHLADLVLVASHTHSGPGGLSEVPLWRPAMGPYDPALFAWTAARIEAVVRAAHADLRPARLRGGRRTTPALARLVRNRARPEGRVDPSIGVLRIDDPDGRPRGVVVHFAAHPTILPASSMQVSADWPGALCAALEREVPGATALFWNGAMGDVSPVVPEGAGGTPPEDPFARVAAYGEAVAAEALAEWKDLVPTVPGAPPDDGFRLRVRGTTTVEGRTAAGRLLGGEPASALVPDAPWPLPVARFDLAWTAPGLPGGEIEVVTVPGEPTASADGALGPHRGAWVVSCAQDHLGYFTDRSGFRAGGYEADLSLFGPDATERIEAAMGRTPYRRTGPDVSAGPPDLSRPVVLQARGVPRDDAPWALGHAHGRLLSEQVRDLLRRVEPRLADQALGAADRLATVVYARKTGLSPSDLTVPALVRTARRLQRDVPADLLDEMEGIAAAAEVPFDSILLLNLLLPPGLPTDPRAGAECAPSLGLAATADATSMGQLLHGSTLAGGATEVFRNRSVVLVVDPWLAGHPFVSVTWPGMVGVFAGMNAPGIALAGGRLPTPADLAGGGLPAPLLLRQVLQRADSLESAVSQLGATPVAGGSRVLASDGRELYARLVVLSGVGASPPVRPPLPGARMAGGLLSTDPGSPAPGAAPPRNPRAEAARTRLEAAFGRIRLGDLQAALGDPMGGVLGVLGGETLLAAVFEPQLLRFHVARGQGVDPAAGRLTWETGNLLELLPEETRTEYAPPWPVEGTGVVEVRPRVQKLAGVRIEEIRFESPVRSGVPENDFVEAELTTPEDPVGVVILLPHWKEPKGAPAQRLFALALARERLAVLLLPLPYQYARAPAGVRSGDWTLSADLARTREASLQAVADVGRASLWLEGERGFPPSRQGLVGTSLGGHVASGAMGAWPDRFAAGVLLLAGASTAGVLFEENGVTDGLRSRLLERGVTPEEAADLLRGIDPAGRARPDLADRILLVGGTEDRVASPERVAALARAWGGARVLWFEGGHTGIVRHAPKVLSEVVAHLRGRFEAP